MCSVPCSAVDGFIRCPPEGYNQVGEFVSLQYNGVINATIWGNYPSCAPIPSVQNVVNSYGFMFVFLVCCFGAIMLIKHFVEVYLIKQKR